MFYNVRKGLLMQIYLRKYVRNSSHIRGNLNFANIICLTLGCKEVFPIRALVPEKSSSPDQMWTSLSTYSLCQLCPKKSQNMPRIFTIFHSFSLHPSSRRFIRKSGRMEHFSCLGDFLTSDVVSEDSAMLLIIFET